MTLLAHAPQFSPDDAAAFAQDLYGLRATATPLPSERDQNFVLRAEPGDRYVLKLANGLEERALLEAQNAALAHLALHTAPCPRIIATTAGETIAAVRSPAGEQHFVRLVTYVDGVPLGTVQRRTPELWRDLGATLGRVDRALASFDHPAIHRDFYWDLAHGAAIVREHLPLVADESLREVTGALAARCERDLTAWLPHLRRSAIYNDANDFNVLVGRANDPYSRSQHVTGLIDFGDMVYSYTAADPAVAAAYAMLDQPDPLRVAAELVRGYHGEYPLAAEELAALFDLSCLRLCMSVCIAAYQQAQRPGDAYLSVSQAAIARTLPALMRIHPRFAAAALRHACGVPAVPAGAAVAEWLRAQRDVYPPVQALTGPVAVLDLSVGSPLISGDEPENRTPELARRFEAVLHAAGAAAGIARYDEARWVRTPGEVAGERPTVRLGVDVFVPAGTPVHAPLPGTVHSAVWDHGATVILRHRAGTGEEFYTLYRGLSGGSLDALVPGEPIASGEPFAAVGAPAGNDALPPHLHLQLALDLLELDGAFPQFCRPGERDVWQALSPDPSLLLGLDPARLGPRPPALAETLAARRERLGANLSIAYREPVKIVRGWMQYLYDEDGRPYLDAYNNVPHVGHCHPRVVQAGREQMGVLNTNTRYLHDLINRYAARLCATLPEPLRVCYFVNSASEANELALRLARAHTGRRDMIVLAAAYHGHTNTLIDISPYKHDGPGGTGAPAWVHTAPVPDTYRGAYRRDDPHAAERYAAHVGELAAHFAPAAYIAETCPSVGGQIFMPDGYLAAAYRYVRAQGGVCIADEVQTGYGRIGTHFWAFEAHGVVPDIVVMGKPIGNGHPIGAVVTTPEIAASFDNGMEFFSTFGGNPVSCAIGLAVLDVMAAEGLQAHALRVGERLLAGLRPLAARYPIVGDVRGSGLFLGVELVRDRDTLEPATGEAGFVANRMRELGILLGTDGPYHNVLKIRPPMPFAEPDADTLVAALDTILGEDLV